FRELERLVQRLHRPSRRDPPVPLASRQAPGTPSVRPQPFGDGAARQPGKLSDRAHSQLFELLVAVALERKQRERQRCEEAPRAIGGADQRPPQGQSGPQIEGRNDDCGDHGNVCSTRTPVPLSSSNRHPAGTCTVLLSVFVFPASSASVSWSFAAPAATPRPRPTLSVCVPA